MVLSHLIDQAIHTSGVFTLFRQSILPLKEGGLQHYEVLLRIKTNGAFLSPAKHIEEAEKHGLMARFDRWVISRVLAYLSSNKTDTAIYTINISGQTINENGGFQTWLTGILQESSVSPDQLVFELTETTAIQNKLGCLELINFLRSLGCKIALDDFGKGELNFSHLKLFRPEYLKIAGLYVRAISINSDDLAILEGVQLIASRMGILTVAEWVESDHVLEQVQKIGCDFAQGYALGRPEPFGITAFIDG